MCLSGAFDPVDCSPPSLLCSWDFPSRNNWIGLPSPSPGNVPDLGIEPKCLVSPALQADSLLLEPTGNLIIAFDKM